MSDLDFLQEPTSTPTTDDKAQRGTSGRSLALPAIIGGLLIVFGIFAVQLFRQNQIRPQPGDEAPAFTLTSFDGAQTVTLDELRGQIVVVNFWGSWCAPCHAEAEDLQAVHEDYADQGVVFIGVNWLDSDVKALDFIDEYDITYLNGPDIGEDIARDYRIQGAPETFIIDHAGVVQEVIISEASYDHLTAILDDLLEART